MLLAERGQDGGLARNSARHEGEQKESDQRTRSHTIRSYPHAALEAPGVELGPGLAEVLVDVRQTRDVPLKQLQLSKSKTLNPSAIRLTRTASKIAGAVHSRRRSTLR